MITLPAITCVFGIGLAVVFEAAYDYIDKRWDTPLDKDNWLLVFWAIVIAVLICCGAMPLTTAGLFHWAPFCVVVSFHFFMVSGNQSFCRRKILPPQYSPTVIPPTPPANPNVRNVKNTKPNNNNQNA